MGTSRAAALLRLLGAVRGGVPGLVPAVPTRGISLAAEIDEVDIPRVVGADRDEDVPEPPVRVLLVVLGAA